MPFKYSAIKNPNVKTPGFAAHEKITYGVQDSFAFNAVGLTDY